MNKDYRACISGLFINKTMYVLCIEVDGESEVSKLN